MPAATKKQAAPPGRHAKRSLAVRMLAAQSEWLEGGMAWRDGAVAFEGPWGSFAPVPADFARAQRTIMRIRSYPQSSRLLFGDVDSWLIARNAKLASAKRMVQAGAYLADLAI